MKKESDIEKFDSRMRNADNCNIDLDWYTPSTSPMKLVGFPWFEQDKVYRRMPVNPTYKLSEAVDTLANHTSGGQVMFQSDTNYIGIRVTLAGLSGMCHMPATGQCGFDIYIGKGKSQYFSKVTCYDIAKDNYEIMLFEHSDSVTRNFTINFPLYQGVTNVSIGLSKGCKLTSAAPYADNDKIIIYGTSITHGGCASRPGMSYPNILSRALNMQTINLGFSGSGKGEPEVAHTISEIDNPKLFILDYEANQGDYDKLKSTLIEFIDILHSKHPSIPIIVMSRVAFTMDLLSLETLNKRKKSADMQKTIVEQINSSSKKPFLYFVDGSKILGDDFDNCMVDGVHLTDLGFLRIAQHLEPIIRNIIAI